MFRVCIGAGICDGMGRGEREGIDDGGMFDFRKIEIMMERRLSNKIAAHNAGWTSQFRFAGSVLWSGVCELGR